MATCKSKNKGIFIIKLKKLIFVVKTATKK